MAASHPNAAISDTFGDASDAVTPTSAFVIPAGSRTNALAFDGTVHHTKMQTNAEGSEIRRESLRGRPAIRNPSH